MGFYYLGFDISTQSAKLLVFDYDQRQPLMTLSVNYDRDLPHYQTVDGAIRHADPRLSESDPQMWLEAVDRLLTAFKASGVDGSKVRAMSVSGQQHGLVCLDEKGELTRGTAKLWNDGTTADECRELTLRVGGPEAMRAEVGSLQKPGFTAAKILHFKKEDPAQFARTTTFFLVHNYINFYLTGGVRVMEPGDTSGMALWHPVRRRFSAKVCAAIDPTLIEKLPRVVSSTEFIGTLAPELALKYGINPDCRIDAGSGDNMYGAIGTGNVEPGVVTVSLGTSGTAYAYCDELPAGLDPEVAPFCDATGHYLPLVCVANLANGYNQFLKNFGLTHEDFERLAGETEVGAGGRLLLPWFTGERTPDLPDARPLWLGFSVEDFTPALMGRALLEGHMLNLYEAYTRLGQKAGRLRLTGGLARSRLFRQTLADVFAVPVDLVEGEGAALGAALHAAWIDQGGDLAQLVQETIVVENSHQCVPNPHHAEQYLQLKMKYHDLSLQMIDFFNRRSKSDCF
jgi:xylulokinase